MRFNPKARLDTGRVRDAGGSRGGGGLGGALGGGRGGGLGGGGSRMPIPGGRAGGGGLVGIMVVVIYIVLTQCMGGSGGGGALPIDGSALPQSGIDTSRMGGSDRYASCDTGEDAENNVDCARVAVENSLRAYWAETLPQQSNAKFVESAMNTFTGSVSTACGQASSQVGPFYCPANSQIYLDTTFFTDVLQGQLDGQGGDFVEPYVLAHEYGHHIQNLLGTMGQVRTQQGPESDAVRLELQADCYAGMWTGAASDGDGLLLGLDQSDIAEALDSAQAVGDDRIQQRTAGRVNPEGWTHGSSEQRMRWFQTGLDQQSLQACDTFSANQL